MKFDLMLIYEGFSLKTAHLFQLFQFAKSELEQDFCPLRWGFMKMFHLFQLFSNLKRARKEYRKGSIYVFVYRGFEKNWNNWNK